MENYEGPKYYTTSDKVKETIRKYGIAIVPDLLDSDEIEAIKDGSWEYLETVTQKFNNPIRRADKTTWGSIKGLYPINGMQLTRWKIGHAQYIWDLRQNPKILDVFCNIWNKEPEELLVSFDGASIGMPPEATTIKYEKKLPPLHCDQRYSKNTFESVQSWINGYETRPGDATLAFYEGSHKFHKDFAEKFGHEGDDKDFYTLTKEENDYYIDRCGIHKSVMCPAGSLVLWDSRLIHCGQQVLKNRPRPNMRSVVFLCYAPRSQITAENLRKKQQAFLDMSMTTHWPTRVVIPRPPNLYGKRMEEITNIPRPVVSEVGMKLAGF